ncbi:MAG: hypothetical protein ACRENB_12535 [Gemmatimonadales bacterium]
MARRPPSTRSDPDELEVDRLLADLRRGSEPVSDSGTYPAARPSARSAAGRPARTARAPSERALAAAFWARVVLVLALGAAMTQWPYAHRCGTALFGYLGAVATVMLSGGWIACASWKRRSPVAHLVSLILVFWGFVLAAEQVLPRVGYAAEQVGWSCDAGGRRR